MTLKYLFLKLKGNSRSGNWAHEGRPGKVGGSSSGGGFSRLGNVVPDTTREDLVNASAKLRLTNKFKVNLIGSGHRGHTGKHGGISSGKRFYFRKGETR